MIKWIGFAVIIIVFGFACFCLGIGMEHETITKKSLGTINVDRSTDGYPNLFFEAGAPIEEISKREYIYVKIKNENYLEEKENG